jgi:P27 family predicted phage terminase small subunit
MPGTSSSGGRGHNRKSLKQHTLAGTGRKDRGTKGPATSADADPPPGRPPTPKGLSGIALDEWTRMVNRLEASRILSTVDDAALYQYCCLFAETEGIQAARRTNARLLAKLEAALDRVRHEDQVAAVASAIGDLQRVDAKHVQQLRQGHIAIRQYLVEFGMTPAARSRVRAHEAPAPEDPFAEFDLPADSTH